jgi:hypothetical protein
VAEGGDPEVHGQTGLLLVTARPSPEDEAVFNRWYDEDHAPAMAHRAGIVSSRRYFDTAEPGRYLARYDLDRPEVLAGPEFVAAEAASTKMPIPEDRRVRRLYRRIAGPAVSRGEQDISGEAILCMWWTPAVGDEDELRDWYDEEHTPALMAIPGWLRVRRYERLEGPGTTFLAVHELDSEKVLESPPYEHLMQHLTPRWTRLRASRTAAEMRAFRLLRRFERATTDHRSKERP